MYGMAYEPIPLVSSRSLVQEADLQGEVTSIQRAQASSSEKITRTVVGFANLKLVLVSIPAGHTWAEHKTPGRISVQVLIGHVRMTALGTSFDLAQGCVLALESNVPHDVQAIEASVFLLTVAR